MKTKRTPREGDIVSCAFRVYGPNTDGRVSLDPGAHGEVVMTYTKFWNAYQGVPAPVSEVAVVSYGPGFDVTVNINSLTVVRRPRRKT